MVYRSLKFGNLINTCILITLLYISVSMFESTYNRRYIQNTKELNNENGLSRIHQDLPQNNTLKFNGDMIQDTRRFRFNNLVKDIEDSEGPDSARERLVYLITPTYTRMTQPPDLTRLAQTVMAATGVHWIVIEDSDRKSPFVTHLLSRMRFGWTHLTSATTQYEKQRRLRGCSQRNAGLEWILKQNITSGILYFGDDDNSFDIRLFDELRKIKEVGMLPVGNMIITGGMGPVVKDSNITGFFYNWVGERKWPIDMANFGVNIDFWRQRGAPKFKVSRRAYLETDFLQAMKVTYDNLEPLAENCTQVLVWHTKTEKVRIEKHTIANKTAMHNDSNIPAMLKNAFL